jgi:hypothetical protein
MIRKIAFGISMVALTAAGAFAAAPASDNAGNPPYSDGWQTTDNGGTGFTTWTFTTAGAGNHYIGATGDGANTFGIFAGGGAGNSSSVDRSFAGGSLLSGETFSLTLGADAVATNGVIGLNLISSGSPVFTFKFTGGQSLWQLNDGGSDFNTNIPFASNTPITFSFKYNGGSSYDVVITEGTTTYSGIGFTAGNNISNITGFRVFSNAQGAGFNVGFNDLAVIPEPSTLSLLAAPAILGAIFFARRRRA